MPGRRRLTVSTVAFDRATSRTIGPDGHMRVGRSVISAAEVSQYYGREVPNGPELGLEPGRLYNVLRSPDELRRAAATFSGKPLTILHRPQTADDHDHDIVVGSVGAVTFDGAHLLAELTVWDGAAIALIQSREQSALSCGYFFDAVPERGTFNGVPYTLRMRGIVGNHLSLVPEGRVKAAMVGDARPEQRRRVNWRGKFAAADKAPAPPTKDANVTDETTTKLLQFLDDRLDPDDLTFVRQLLEADAGGGEPEPDMAADSLRRRVAQGVTRQRAATGGSYDKLFPNARRLG